MAYADSIRALCWGEIPTAERPTWIVGQSHLWALWPSPVNADACFEAAGFREFADPLDDWNKDWKTMIERVLTVLQTHFGAARIREMIQGDDNRTFWGRIRRQPRAVLSIAEQVELATYDDNAGSAIVDFGSSNHALLHADNGHEILWVAAPSDGWPHILREIAGELPLQKLELRWSMLLPT